MDAHRRYKAELDQLRHRVKEHETLEKEFSNLELKCKQLLEENYELGCANDELGFQNKLLLAMATVTEGDYHNLCVEAGYNPREEQIRVLH
jgi:predicted nuclease with TOPRIM domain